MMEPEEKMNRTHRRNTGGQVMSFKVGDRVFFKYDVEQYGTVMQVNVTRSGTAMFGWTTLVEYVVVNDENQTFFLNSERVRAA